MPVGEDSRFATARRQVIRRITVVRGRLDLRVTCKPAFNYVRDRHQAAVVKHGVEFHFANPRLDSLVYRYDVGQTIDGLRAAARIFNICTIWLADALTQRRPLRPAPARRGPADVRADVRPRQSCRLLRRGDRAERRGARQLPAGVPASRADQRRPQSRPCARRRPWPSAAVAMDEWQSLPLVIAGSAWAGSWSRPLMLAAVYDVVDVVSFLPALTPRGAPVPWPADAELLSASVAAP
jgi:hypothetical protein